MNGLLVVGIINLIAMMAMVIMAIRERGKDVSGAWGLGATALFALAILCIGLGLGEQADNDQKGIQYQITIDGETFTSQDQPNIHSMHNGTFKVHISDENQSITIKQAKNINVQMIQEDDQK